LNQVDTILDSTETKITTYKNEAAAKSAVNYTKCFNEIASLKKITTANAALVKSNDVKISAFSQKLT